MNSVYFTKEKFLADSRELNLDLPYCDDPGILGESVKIGDKTVHNRLACQAMEGCDGTPSGAPDVLTKRRYERFAKGGAGLIWFEATAVLPEARANPRQLYIHENNLDDYKYLVESIKETALKENGHEPVIVMQATHSGRYSKPNGTPEPLIAYHNPIFENGAAIDDSRIVTDEYLDTVKDALIDGARLAEKAGFDGVDIKCCHRYLNSELLSAYDREGKYGGCLENRTRLLRESIKGAIETCGKEFLVSSRLNVYDGFSFPYGFGVKPDGGLEFDETEPVWLLKQLYSYGVKLVNITMGNPYFNPHVNRPYAQGGYEPPEHPLFGVARMLNGTARLKKQVPELKMICSALSFLGVCAPHVAAGFIRDGGFDFAGFGRTAFAYPDFANDILHGGMDRNKCCICCSKCTQIMRQKGGTPGCVIRDRETYLPIFKKFCEGDQK